MENEHFFHTKLADGVYQIFDPLHGPNEDGKSLLPGNATRNSYLVIGSEKALLFDLALEAEGLHKYAEQVAGVPIITVLSHAHIDHIYHISDEREVWLGREDATLLRKGAFPIQPPVCCCPKLQMLDDGDILDLGGRILNVIHIPGHTNGSILLYDSKTGILFSGDTCTRRLLYGMHGDTPVDTFCNNLQRLNKFTLSAIYSAHDRCALYPEHIDLMVSVMKEEGDFRISETTVPVIGKMITVEYGSEDSIRYFSYAYKTNQRRLFHT